MLLPISIDRRLEAVKLALTSLAVAMLLAACGAPGGGGFGPGAPAITGSTGNVKVAVLLPITSSGSTPAVAKALKQAAELALFDFDNPSVTLIPKDTKGSPDGARLAAESALRDGAELIIGPLFAAEVSGAAPVARQGGVPMIAFSSDEKVAGNGVYLLSFLAGREMPRIVSFAMSRGKRNFAELIPQSAYGRIAETAFARAVSSGGGQASVRATFPPNDSTAMLGPVRQVANAVKSGQGGAVLARGARRAARACAAAGLGGPLQRTRAVHRHRAVGLSQYRQRPSVAWRLVPRARPKGLEQFRAALFQDLRRRAAAHREPRL